MLHDIFVLPPDSQVILYEGVSLRGLGVILNLVVFTLTSIYISYIFPFLHEKGQVDVVQTFKNELTLQYDGAMCNTYQTNLIGFNRQIQVMDAWMGWCVVRWLVFSKSSHFLTNA